MSKKANEVYARMQARGVLMGAFNSRVLPEAVKDKARAILKETGDKAAVAFLNRVTAAGTAAMLAAAKAGGKAKKAAPKRKKAKAELKAVPAVA